MDSSVHIADGRPQGRPQEQTLIPLHRLSFECSDFFVGEKRVSRQLFRTLDGRDGLVRVGPMQVRVAPRGLGSSLTIRPLAGSGQRRQNNECDEAQRPTKATTICNLPARHTVQPTPEVG